MSFSLNDAPHLGLNAARARQARYGRPVLWVLLFSTLLAALALFGALSHHGPRLAGGAPAQAAPAR
ncbi:hypothetical protein [Phenylobacterium aquaticum]|uniref:hypothetical protein n=1 Tax=Phenylobacterium aquaticum TaxID=1763816 RepID=UPI0026EA5BC1|nr:hypothetical protein [Phenylobacterium aquaticum]